MQSATGEMKKVKYYEEVSSAVKKYKKENAEENLSDMKMKYIIRNDGESYQWLLCGEN